MRALLSVSVALCALLGCKSGDGDSEGGASGNGGDGDSCNVTAPTACPSDMPTYADVEAIIEQRCVVCHSGSASELCPTCWPLNTYRHVADWSSDVRAAMLSCSMPPPESGVTMTAAERMKILEWIRCEF